MAMSRSGGGRKGGKGQQAIIAFTLRSKIKPGRLLFARFFIFEAIILRPNIYHC